MSIYTKTGDAGKTSLVGGTRVDKSDERIDLYGQVDELNSFLGLLLSTMIQEKTPFKDKKTYELLQRVQNELFNLGSNLACEIDHQIKFQLLPVSSKIVLDLESSIDSMQLELPLLKNFILPGGNTAASCAHICRTVCRRVERNMVRFYAQQNNHEIHASINHGQNLIFLNRLSDYFFVLARYINHLHHEVEIKWIKE